MKPAVTFFACLAIVSPLALTHTVVAQTSPTAFVYVSSNAGGISQINAYSADSTGRLTPVLGSPFSASVAQMALNGAFLFGTDGTFIYSFTIAPNGSLQQVSSINAASFNPFSSSGPTALFLDHTGATLYDGDTNAYGTESNAYQSFSIDKSTGQLNFLAITPDGGPNAGTVLSFTGSNVFAYSSGCSHQSPQIIGYQRNPDQTLSPLNLNPTIPAASNGAYCPFLAAADPFNHVAISMTPFSIFSQSGPPQLAVYTQDNSGNLTTTSTSANMPASQVGSVNDFWMAPSGKLLAVGGTSGLQIFHFNGANPVTHYTGLLTKDPIDQMFWDNANHLFAISRSTGKLYVFTVTPNRHSPAPGSPYTIASPENIIVLPKT